jgi:hypothetical protein
MHANALLEVRLDGSIKGRIMTVPPAWKEGLKHSFETDYKLLNGSSRPTKKAKTSREETPKKEQVTMPPPPSPPTTKCRKASPENSRASSPLFSKMMNSGPQEEDELADSMQLEKAEQVALQVGILDDSSPSRRPRVQRRNSFVIHRDGNGMLPAGIGAGLMRMPNKAIGMAEQVKLLKKRPLSWSKAETNASIPGMKLPLSHDERK